MSAQFLYEKFNSISSEGLLNKEMPDFLTENLNSKFELREYQIEAFTRFIHYVEKSPNKEYPIHLLFNMATGSGKTLIMAGLILYLYNQGHRNFLFFVNSSNIIEKTKDNFLNNLSGKYLFNEKILFGDRQVQIRQANNFDGASDQDINICFTTIQKLHSDLYNEKENSLTLQDFKEKKIILISDEAHHGQAQTKQKALNEALEKPNWENTIEKIFKQNPGNFLLEFTATMDFLNKNIVEKYKNKIIYKYELKEFRNGGYSKDVELLHTNTDKNGRILQAMILSQYRQEVAGKYGINLKPVILFKAQRTIADSEENKKIFHEMVDNLEADGIENIREKTNIKILNKAFQFFKDNKITDAILIKRLKDGFAENKTLSVNEEHEKEKYQLLLNSLEDKENQIRAIFAVQKLNEGWDVLNLFDIVRLYETRDGKNNQPGKTTISEAQLIGRGARYYPFKTKEEDEKFKRKYDKYLDSELRILEELYYHSHNESRYITEIKTALIQEGMIDENEVEVDLELKEEFKKSSFYKTGLVYANERKKRSFEKVKRLEDLGIRKRSIDYKIMSGEGAETNVFADGTYFVREGAGRTGKEVRVKDIDDHIIRNALVKNDFYNLDRLKKYIPKLKSAKEFIEKDKYLAGFKINFIIEKYISEISREDKFKAMLKLLFEVENEIKGNLTEYEGTEKFIPGNFYAIFPDFKKLKIKKDSSKADGQKEFLEDKDWYVFNANYGTSEEKAFVEMIDRQIGEFKEILKIKKFYLVRNEKQLKIYNFKDGKAFEPDYLLFLIDKAGNGITYQLFLEPKGSYLAGSEKWKSDFLEEIREKFKGKTLEFSKSKKYKIVGVQFYNQETENEFKEKLFEALE